MANFTANAIDWWLDKLTKTHILPTNLITLARDISAKQIGGKGFTPRNLTADSFSDAELEAIRRLALAQNSQTYSPVTSESYRKIFPAGKPYGVQDLTLGEYSSPARSVSTTLGQFGMRHEGKDSIAYDTYDFNRDKVKVMKGEDGALIAADDTGLLKEYQTEEEKKKFMLSSILGLGRDNTAFGRVHNNAARLGHSSTDPDSEKIHTRISMNDVEKRLKGKRFDNIDKAMSSKELILRGAAAGGLTGIPIGAGLGLLYGLTSLINKDRRKKWGKTLAYSALAGSALAGLAGAAAGGIGMRAVNSRFMKKGSADVYPAGAEGQNKNIKRKRKNWLKKFLYTTIPIVTPVTLAALASHKIKSKVSGIYSGLMKDVDYKNEIDPEYVESESDLLPQMS